MKYHPVFWLLLTLMALTIGSCKKNTDSSVSVENPLWLKPSSGGKTLEVLVICPEDQYKTTFGEPVRHYFASPVPYMNQAEPLFDLVPMNPAGYKKSEMFQKHRNILIINYDKTRESNKLFESIHTRCYPQAVFELSINHPDSLLPLLQRHHLHIINQFRENEHLRVDRAFKEMENLKITKALQKKFHFWLTVSEDFYSAKDTPGFAWLRMEPKDASLNFLIHTAPYRTRHQVDSVGILSLRDSLGKAHIPGPTPGSHMATERRYPCGYKSVNIQGLQGKETRGLWKLDGQEGQSVRSFMGGPFVNYTLIDEKHDRIITIDCFLYSPRRSKRDLLIQMESVVHNLRFGEPE